MKMWIMRALEKVSLSRWVSPFPNSKVMNREVAPLIEAFRKLIMATIPPTTPYIPKSSTPRTCNTTLDVYSPIATDNSIRIYSIIVFFAICLLFESMFHKYYIRLFPRISGKYFCAASIGIYRTHITKTPIIKPPILLCGRQGIESLIIPVRYALYPTIRSAPSTITPPTWLWMKILKQITWKNQ